MKTLAEESTKWGVKYTRKDRSGQYFAPLFYERRLDALAYKLRLDGALNNPRSIVVKVRVIFQEL